MQVLVADIGGTHTTLAIMQKTKTTPKLVYKKQWQSSQVKDISIPIKQMLKQHKVTLACLAGAGPVLQNKITISNTGLVIDQKKVQKQTALKITLINDFEAIGHALESLNKKQYKQITKNNLDFTKTIAVIGPGTGLGKCIRLPNRVILPSEGGYADVSIYAQEELALAEFIKEEAKYTTPLDADLAASGRAIPHIYNFYYTHSQPNKKQKEIYGLPYEEKTKIIAELSQQDALCNKTMEMLTRFCARSARNFVLEVLATGGIVIAGGVAAKNPDWFTSKVFTSDFANHIIYTQMLKNIPKIVVTDYAISLTGAANRAFKHVSH